MNNILQTQTLRVVGAIVSVVVLSGLAGCATGPGSNGTQSSGYKGSAPWNISRAEQASRAAS